MKMTHPSLNMHYRSHPTYYSEISLRASQISYGRQTSHKSTPKKVGNTCLYFWIYLVDKASGGEDKLRCKLSPISSC